MNSVEPTSPYIPPTTKNEQELKDYCSSGVYMVLNPNGTNACAMVQGGTTTRIEEIQGSHEIQSQPAVNTTDVAVLTGGVLLATATLIALKNRFTKIRNRRKEPVHSIHQLLEPKKKITKEEIEKQKGFIEKALKDALSVTGNKKEEQDNLSVTFAFLSRNSDIDLWILNEVQWILLDRVVNSNRNDRVILREKTLGTLQTLGFLTPQYDIKKNLDNTLTTKLDELFEIIKAIEDYIRYSTPTQSPAAPVTPDTDSSEKTV